MDLCIYDQPLYLIHYVSVLNNSIFRFLRNCYWSCFWNCFICSIRVYFIYYFFSNYHHRRNSYNYCRRRYYRHSYRIK